MDEEVELKPDACPKCHGPLDEPIGWEERYLVGIEPARRVTRRFRTARRPCRNCGTVVSLHAPGSVPRSHYGRRVHARVAHLRSVGIPYGKIREVLKAEYSIDLDETTWPVDGEDQWLWCAVSDGAAVYAVEESRGRDAAKAMLGDFRGVLTHDGWTAYYKLDCPQQQCFVHIHREYGDPRADQLADGLRRRRHQMFNFLRYPGVEWRSNEVEREIRPMVAFRRNCHGSKSWSGARALAVLVSVRESCRRSGRSFLELLEKTLSGCARGRPVG